MTNTGSRPMNPVEALAQDNFKLEEPLALFGRDVGLILVGGWLPDGTAEGILGLASLEPVDFCRIVVLLKYAPDVGLAVSRIVEGDDARDNDEVISRFFEKPMEKIMAAISLPLGRNLARAADARELAKFAEEEGDDDELLPVREMTASATVH